MADIIYAKGINIKKRSTNFGDVLKLSVKTDDFIEFLKEHTNENGWVNLDVMERKEVSDKGFTHYAKLDTWKPNQTSQQPSKSIAKSSSVIDDDEIPF